MTLQQAVALACKDDLYGTETQDKLIVLPLQPDESQGRWYVVIEDWNKQEYVALYAHSTSGPYILEYLAHNRKERLSAMASHHLASNNWRVMTRWQFVRFNKEGDHYDT